jgi:hypothetical protein
MKLRSLALAFILLIALLPNEANAQGNFSSSLRFYGHGNSGIDRVLVQVDPPTAADVGLNFTLEFWLRALPGENNGRASCGVKDGWITGNILFDRDIWGAGDYGDWGISLSQGRIAVGITRFNSGTTLCGRSKVDDGVWHHVAITRRASDGLIRIFVDGSLDRQGYGPKGDISYRDGRATSHPADPYLVIGAEKHDAGVEYPSFSGWLDEVRLSTVIRYSGRFYPPSQPFEPDSTTAFLFHFDESASGACSGSVIDAAQHVNGICYYGGNAPEGPVYTADTPFFAQKIAVPAYFEPGTLWTTLQNAAPVVGLAVINPNNGPGPAADPDYFQTVRQNQASGILTLGYVATHYGQRNLSIVRQEIQRYFNWYGVNGIFLDEGSPSCARIDYYKSVYAYIKSLRPAARVVINPGINPGECYMQAADIILNFEDDFQAYQNWLPATWVYKYPAQRFWHLVIGADASQMRQAIRLAKGRHAGWIYVTPDTLPDPWDTLPDATYWQQEQDAVNGTFWGQDFKRGVSYAAWWQGLYQTVDSDRLVSQVIPSAGVNWIAIVPTCYQPTVHATSISCNIDSRTVTDAELSHVIQLAHANGLKVMLKPHVDPQDGHWRGEINFGSDEAAWQAWFTSYTAFIRHYAQMAEALQVELFSVGVEYEQTTHRESDWRNVISAVRGDYSGPITYAANWGGEETAIQWWDAVDFIGVDAYYELTNKNNPTLAELRAGWQPYLNQLNALSQTWNKPVLFTEIGYRSVDGSNRHPWDWGTDAPLDLQEQAMAYQTILDLSMTQPWLQGIFWWTWMPTDLTQSGPSDKGYAIYRKPAFAVLRGFYRLPAP